MPLSETERNWLLRAYAGLALQAYLTNPHVFKLHKQDEPEADAIARACFVMAEALIRQDPESGE